MLNFQKFTMIDIKGITTYKITLIMLHIDTNYEFMCSPENVTKLHNRSTVNPK